MSAQRGGMDACAAQAVAVRPRQMLCGAASHEACSARADDGCDLRGRIRPPRRAGASVVRWGAAA
eukprot:807922-Prymnesium_polylepis.1